MDIFFAWAERKFDKKPDPSEIEAEQKRRSEHKWLAKRADLLEGAADDQERITKRLLPWGWASTLLGTFLLLSAWDVW